MGPGTYNVCSLPNPDERVLFAGSAGRVDALDSKAASTGVRERDVDRVRRLMEPMERITELRRAERDNGEGVCISKNVPGEDN